MKISLSSGPDAPDLIDLEQPDTVEDRDMDEAVPGPTRVLQNPFNALLQLFISVDGRSMLQKYDLALIGSTKDYFDMSYKGKPFSLSVRTNSDD